VAESLALADGYLVAAAPDLLAALKACVEQLSAYEERHWLGEAWRTRIGLRKDLDAARRAIANAEGRHGGRWAMRTRVKYQRIYGPNDLDKAIKELGTLRVLSMINQVLHHAGSQRRRAYERKLQLAQKAS